MATEETRKYWFGDLEIDAPADMPAEEVRSVWASTGHPALENAEIVENDDGSVSFHLRGGTKGWF